MTQSSTAFIVSAFGRGHWLAAHLQKQGIETTLLDVSAQLGQWPAEICEGPFGLLKSDQLDELMLASLNSGDLWQELPEGFSLWTQKEVFDFKGPLIRFKLEKMGLSSEMQEALLAGQTSKAMQSLEFQKQWLPALLTQLSSTYYLPSIQALSKNSEIPGVGANYSVRYSTRQGHEKSLHWLSSMGVRVLSQSELVDLAHLNKKSLAGAELRGEQQGVYRFEQLVWGLTSEETYFLNEKVAKQIFTQQNESVWCWLRYRIHIGPCIERDLLPLSSVLLEDEMAPWTHENMMILQRTVLPEQFDIWLRLPTVQRFNKDYLTQRGGEIVRTMRGRLTSSEASAEIKIQTYPQEYYYTYAQLGAPRFPLFDSFIGGGVKMTNLHFLSPETWRHYGAHFMSMAEKELSSGITKWWQQKQLAEQKKKNQIEGDVKS